MKTKNTWLALLVVLAVVALGALAAGCGSDEQTSSTTESGNAADAAFVTDMTVHHEAAIEMARIAQKRAQHAEIRNLAADIVSAQEREITTMNRIEPELPKGQHGAGHMGMSESEMGMDMDPTMLNDAKPFDRAFIDMMVPHHEGAVKMAKQQLKDGAEPRLRRMAKGIITAQAKEIAQMRGWRKAWYGSSDSMDDHGHGSP
jgi:uncharacterized protein (DUF305 family)